nr:uncharacterized protein LOC129266036 [Lytechinus pictus]
MDHARLDVDRQEQRMREWIINRPTTTPRGPSVTGQSGRSTHAHRRDHLEQRENNRTARPRSDQIIYPPTTGLTGRRPNPLFPELPLTLLQPTAQQSRPEHRVHQLSDMEQIHRTLSQYHMQRRSRPDESEQGDQRQQQQQQWRPQHAQRPHPAGEVRTMRNDIERTRDNIVRELRQQAHRVDNREGYVSRVMALVRERHSLSDHQVNNHGPGSRSGHSPPEQQGQVGPPNVEHVQRLNPRPPRRRRRCQKHYNGAIYQPKKE